MSAIEQKLMGGQFQQQKLERERMMRKSVLQRQRAEELKLQMLAEKFKAESKKREGRVEREESSSSSDCDEPVGAYLMLRKEREMFEL